MEQVLIRLTIAIKKRGMIKARELRMSFAAYIESLIKKDLGKK